MKNNKLPKLSIIILNWNGLHDTLSCLSTVFNSDYRNFNVIVIDNKSNENELEIIKDKYPKIYGYQSIKNLGFTGGCNLGISIAIENNADYICLLNNDALVLPDTFSNLMQKMILDPSIGMISPIIFDNEHKHLLYCGVSIDLTTLRRNTIKSIEELVELKNKPNFVLGLWGTALFLRRTLLDQIGFLDEQFFAYHEDMDISIRSIKNGWKNEIDVDAAILHGEKEAVRRIGYYFYMHRNEYLLLIKHLNSNSTRKNIANYFSRSIRKAYQYKLEGKDQISHVCLDGLWNAYKNNFGEWDYRERLPKLFSTIILKYPLLTSRLIKLVFLISYKIKY